MELQHPVAQRSDTRTRVGQHQDVRTWVQAGQDIAGLHAQGGRLACACECTDDDGAGPRLKDLLLFASWRKPLAVPVLGWD